MLIRMYRYDSVPDAQVLKSTKHPMDGQENVKSDESSLQFNNRREIRYKICNFFQNGLQNAWQFTSISTTKLLKS